MKQVLNDNEWKNWLKRRFNELEKNKFGPKIKKFNRKRKNEEHKNGDNLNIFLLKLDLKITRKSNIH